MALLEEGGVKNLQEGAKLVEYCKACKTYIADSELIKKRGKKVLKVT